MTWVQRGLWRVFKATGAHQALLSYQERSFAKLERELKRSLGRDLKDLEKSTERQARRTEDSLADGFRTVQRRVEQLQDRLDDMARQLDAGQRDIGRLEHIVVSEVQGATADRPTPQLDIDRIGAHAGRRIAAAEMLAEPFPHLIVEDLLPDDVFDLLVRSIPDPIFFGKLKKAKHDFRPIAKLAPQTTRAAWGFMDRRVCPEVLMPALLERFRPFLATHLAALFGAELAERAHHLPFTCFDGRVMRRRPGYRLEPHADPKRYFVTALLYLPASRDADERWGTQMFRADAAFAARHRNIVYPLRDSVACTLVKTAPYRRNTLLAFFNAASIHGAEIPPGDAPADLERFAYQFYLGPEEERLKALIAALPADRKAEWATRDNCGPATQTPPQPQAAPKPSL